MFYIINNNNRPIYEQIKEKFIELIINNALREGDKLPSVRELASMLTVNPNTVSKAYSRLEDEGMIETLKGKGTFVKVGVKEVVLAYNYEMLMNKIKDVLESAKNLNIKFNALVDLEKQVLDKLEGK
ncbi:MAG: GntR family transcriptional regulator [Clostridium sp.]|uniref:GntR family transcriptional regulator n=1 Tax=Clostridium sp. TaxID=1506 RepID=UPI0029156998|nr:GntR family transcriptional regulator [Clostridium sp.]MDU4938369.1 GntR family transcriptional regulator [Clostridium sp.]